MNQIEKVSLDQMVKVNHRYRRFKEVWNFKKVDSLLRRRKSSNPHEGYGIERIFRCLLLQFLEDLSDRELEIFLQENSAVNGFAVFY